MVDKIGLDKPKVDEIIILRHTSSIVSEPDPRKNEKEGLAHWPG